MEDCAGFMNDLFRSMSALYRMCEELFMDGSCGIHGSFLTDLWMVGGY